MSYPLELRDALYALFLHTHRLPEGAAIFRSRLAELGARFPRQGRYLRGRARRYLKVMKTWRTGRPGDLSAEVELARLLFVHGLYFDAHEYLETAWRRSSGVLKLRLQGLIQLSAALHKLELDPQAAGGARYLVEKGFEKLAGL
ncbi:MAG: DUF309 domain-containing protein [Elusimicrobia bacterium]|nr:DUF309 domain-containing protein [Elusimicrobiota bacterium]